MNIKRPPLNAEIITEYLPDSLGRFETVALENVGSTNALARSLAAQKKGQFAVVAASQSAGRGTKGRSFCSPEGGLYMSVVLRAGIPAEEAGLLTPAAAVAVCEAAEALGSAPLGIKWVNDIMLGGKKVCGILTETSFNASVALDFAIVGIGVNIAEPEGGFAREVAGVAGALFETAPPYAREKLAAGILARLVPLGAALGERAFVEEYRLRSVVIGKTVAVVSPRGERKALALSMDEDCRLIVQYESGEREALSSGEVRVSPSE